MKWITFMFSFVFFLALATNADAAYIVERGDTMWKISQKYKMSYSDLLSLNPQISDANKISIGQAIAVRSGNTSKDVTDYARNLQGVTTYVYGGNEAPYRTDCSGWTKHIYSKFNVSLPRVSKQQANVGLPVTFKQLQQGDLMFFSSNSDKSINHVGIYLGDGKWISNLNSKYSVKIQSIYDSYTQKYFMWGQRVL